MNKLISILMMLFIFTACNVPDSTKVSDPLNIIPGDFSILASTTGSNKIAVSWTLSSDATSYKILYKKTTDANFSEGSSVTSSPAVISGLSTGTTYQVKIKAANTKRDKESNEISVTVIAGDGAPLALPLTMNANEDIESIVTLSYLDLENNLAATCSPSSLSGLTVTQACACNGSGVCTVGITSTLDYSGDANFSYSVTASAQTSNNATVAVKINSTEDPPVTANFTPASIPQNTQGIITLGYTDSEGDLASSCSLSALSNVTITRACSCSSSGLCSVGVTGLAGFSGSASFDYTVTANSTLSNSSQATFMIGALDPTMVANSITPPAFNEEIQSIITLSYTDGQADLATSCTVSALTNVIVTQACACDGGGVCTVGVTGNLNVNGSGAFSYTVNTPGLTSNSASATLTITPVDDAPISVSISPPAFSEDVQSIITLSYTDPEANVASSCAIITPTNVTVTSACACDGIGVCSVGVTGGLNYVGAASFNYTVTSNALTSNLSTASLTLISAPDAPISAAINPPAFNEDIQSIITLSYTDAENDLASVCAISTPTNISVSQACACNGSGICTVGVKGTANYFGAASFAYTVSAAGSTSNSATATLNIVAVDDTPVAANITPASFVEDIQSIITLSYTDAETDLATSCSIAALSNVTVTQACACTGAGICTVGVTGTLDYFGPASFSYQVEANFKTSASVTASLTITNFNDPSGTTNGSALDFTAATQSIINLPYTDPEGDLATACAVSALTNVTLSQACACTGAGVCSVGVTGNAAYLGSGSFNYTVTTSGVVSNSATISFNLICPVGYVSVPANAGLGVINFCVMKYEAKNSGANVAVSNASALPWASITHTNAKTQCTDLGVKYDLVSNPEWMTIARNIENEPANWSSGIVGTGTLFRGHSDNSPGSALNVTITTDGYDQTGNSGASSPEQKRVHVLSNSNQIWDFSGNVFEWVDWSISAGFQIVTPANKAFANPPDTDPVNAWREFNILNNKITGTDEMKPETWQSFNPGFTSAQGVGLYYAGINTTGGMAHRGGNWNQGINAGIYSLDLSNATAVSSVGFRCVYRP